MELSFADAELYAKQTELKLRELEERLNAARMETSRLSLTSAQSRRVQEEASSIMQASASRMQASTEQVASVTAHLSEVQAHVRAGTLAKPDSPKVDPLSTALISTQQQPSPLSGSEKENATRRGVTLTDGAGSPTKQKTPSSSAWAASSVLLSKESPSPQAAAGVEQRRLTAIDAAAFVGGAKPTPVSLQQQQQLQQQQKRRSGGVAGYVVETDIGVVGKTGKTLAPGERFPVLRVLEAPQAGAATVSQPLTKTALTSSVAAVAPLTAGAASSPLDLSLLQARLQAVEMRRAETHTDVAIYRAWLGEPLSEREQKQEQTQRARLPQERDTRDVQTQQLPEQSPQQQQQHQRGLKLEGHKDAVGGTKADGVLQTAEQQQQQQQQQQSRGSSARGSLEKPLTPLLVPEAKEATDTQQPPLLQLQAPQQQQQQQQQQLKKTDVVTTAVPEAPSTAAAAASVLPPTPTPAAYIEMLPERRKSSQQQQQQHSPGKHTGKEKGTAVETFSREDMLRARQPERSVAPSTAVLPDPVAELLQLQRVVDTQQKALAALEKETVRLRAERDEARSKAATLEQVIARRDSGSTNSSLEGDVPIGLDERLLVRMWRNIDQWRATTKGRVFPPLFQKFRHFISQL